MSEIVYTMEFLDFFSSEWYVFNEYQFFVEKKDGIKRIKKPKCRNRKKVFFTFSQLQNFNKII
jgi:hypothetical protein